MKPHTHCCGTGFTFAPLLRSNITTTAEKIPVRRRCLSPAEFPFNSLCSNCGYNTRQVLSHKRRDVRISFSCRRTPVDDDAECSERPVPSRRDVLVAPFLAIGACVLRSAVARADDKPPEITTPAATAGTETTESLSTKQQVKAPVEEKKEEVINSRIYDATVIGEPMAVGKDKRKVWEKMMNARIVYLGEAEQVPIRDDKELELETVKNLRKRCAEVEQPISLVLEAFPSNLQNQLNQYMDRKYDFHLKKSSFNCLGWNIMLCFVIVE